MVHLFIMSVPRNNVGKPMAETPKERLLTLKQKLKVLQDADSPNEEEIKSIKQEIQNLCGQWRDALIMESAVYRQSYGMLLF